MGLWCHVPHLLQSSQGLEGGKQNLVTDTYLVLIGGESVLVGPSASCIQASENYRGYLASGHHPY
jgi:hypothetical protein